MSYRPDDWEKTKEDKLIPTTDPIERAIQNRSFEAGADALIEALIKEDGTHFEKDEWTDDATFETEVPGWVVFIPDDVTSPSTLK